MRRTLGLALAVLVAMVVGQVITDHVPVGEASVAPFVREGSVGRTVHLSYADVTVTDVRAAGLIGPDHAKLVVKPLGVWLVVDTRLVALREPTEFLSMYLTDTQGRIYPASIRSGCTGNPKGPTVPTAVPTYARTCFDVPKRELPGLRLVVARGSFDDDGLRRDDQAVVDLGIARADATRMARATVAYRGVQDSTSPLSLKPLEVNDG